MKISLTSFCIAVLFLLGTLSSCQQEPDEELDPENPQVSGNLNATIDGSTWVAARAAIGYRMNGLISISGLSRDGKTLTMTLTDSGVHRYVLNANTMNAGAYVDSTLSDRTGFTSNSNDDPQLAGGEVNILSINENTKTMSGTFSFRVYRFTDDRSVSITNGSFTDLKYSTSLPPTTGLDTLRLKVDGVDFVPTVVNGFSSEMLGQMVVTGTDAAGLRSIGITVQPDIIPGTYDFDYPVIGVYNPDTDGTNSRASTSGRLVVLEHNLTTKRLRGTFQFSASNILDPLKKNEITDGYFSVKYP